MHISSDDSLIDEVEQAALEYVSDGRRTTRQFKAKWLDVDADARKVGAALSHLAEQEERAIELSKQTDCNTKKWRYTGDLSVEDE